MDNMNDDDDFDIHGALEIVYAEMHEQRRYVDALRDYAATLEARIRDLELVLLGAACAAHIPTRIDAAGRIGPVIGTAQV